MTNDFGAPVIILFCACLVTNSQAADGSITLKCAMRDDANNTKSELWLVVDKGDYSMSVDGTRRTLSITNDSYSSVERGVAGFTTVYNMNRNTGTLVISTLYEGTVRLVRSGTCDVATPPTTRF